MREQVERLHDDPAGLESLYRRAVASGGSEPFATAIAECSEAAPANVLFRAWACRLGTEAAGGPVIERDGVEGDDAGRRRHWVAALGFAAFNGVLFALFAGDKPPLPVPAEANPLFWVWWAPATAVAVVALIASGRRDSSRVRWHAGAVAGVALVGLLAAALVAGRTDHVATLAALHLPFLAWASIGAAVTLGRSDRAGHTYAFTVQSLEAVVAAGIFFGSGLIFAALTAGLLAVFEIEVPEAMLRAVAAFGIGAIPVLAVASVYDPARSPAQQQPTGVARILRIMTWLLLPAAVVVLALYVVWFIPMHFWRAFEERSVLMVYNATIIAILVALTAAASAVALSREAAAERVMRPAAIGLMTLTLLLNVYALAAIVSRTIAYGLSPNRHAVLGWNVVTLVMLAVLLATSRSGEGDWLPRFRQSLGRVMVLPVGWALWVVCILPLG